MAHTSVGRRGRTAVSFPNHMFMVATNDAGLDEVKRVRQRNVEVDLPVPTCVKRYNGLMGGVDRLDELRAYYSVGHSGKRWWKYIFWGC